MRKSGKDEKTQTWRMTLSLPHSPIFTEECTDDMIFIFNN